MRGISYSTANRSMIVAPADRDVAFVFQQYSLYPSMTVYENLAFPLQSPLRNLPKAEIDQKIREAAEKLRITHLLDRKTANLSGGEMQRVSIGRAIVREPRIYLMDEPLSNLDAKLREALRVELEHLQRTQNSTTLFVTHDQIEALTMADRIAVLNEGKILQIGTPHDIYDRPKTTFVAQLVGTPRINLLNASRQNGSLSLESSDVQLAIPSDTEIPPDFLLGIRPEDIQLSTSGVFSGGVVLTEPLGVETIIHIRSGDLTLLSIVPGTSGIKIGDSVQFRVAEERLHFFDQGWESFGVIIMKFGVNCWVWSSPVTTEVLKELASKVASMGFDQIEIPIEGIGDLDYVEGAAIIKDHSLAVSVCAAMGPDRDLIHEDEGIQKNGMAYIRHCIDGAATLGATNIVGPIYSAVGRCWQQTPDERARDVDLLVSNLGELAHYAHEHGTVLGIEPLNRFETSFINIAPQIIEIVDRIDSDSCGIMLDTFHMNIEEKSLGEAIRQTGQRLIHFHACENDRGAPGTGNVQWEDVAQGLRDINYDGPVVIESFTDKVKTIARAAAIWRPFEPSQDDLARDGLAFLKQLLAGQS